MRKNLTQFLLLILFLLVLFPVFLLAGNASNPNRPFPQHTQYVPGTIKPNNVTQVQLDDSTRTFYERWKARYLKNDCGADQYYVFDDEKSPIICVSEGQGYGMLITAIMAGHDPNAKTYFDGLYNFYKAHPSYINNRLMAWEQITGCISEPLNGLDAATDGDLDIAYGLLLAHSQWGSDGSINYLQEALSIIEAILQDEMNHEVWSVKLGDWATPAEPSYYYGTRTSDFMMDHFRVFKQITGDTSWTKIIEKCYSLINTVQTSFSPVTGILPDFIVDCNTTPKPAPANYLEASTDGSYSYNACRTPWRIATDYLITGDTRAKAALDKINAWIKSATSGDPSKIRSGYRLNGSNIPGTDYSAESFTGPFAVSAMVNPANQQWLNDLWAFNLSYNFDSAYYYENTIKLLTMIVVSGNWWTPQLERTISFSGYTWTIKSSTTKVGPGPNYFSDSTGNVWLDSFGKLHMKITNQNNKWKCSEVVLNRSLGYGRYVFHLESKVGKLDPNIVLGLFTWDDAPAENHRESDIEFSRWADSTDTTNAQFVVQPYYHTGNLVRWKIPETLDSSTNSFDWQMNRISFLSVSGFQNFPPYDSIMAEWEYSGSDVPSPGNENARINLWLYQGHRPTDSNEVEIVVSKFEFNPLPLPPNVPTLLKPTDYSIVESQPITFQWNRAIGTETYHLELSDDSLFSNKIINDSLITDTIFIHRLPANGKTYFWHVQAKNIGGVSGWSPIWRFDYINNTHWKIISVYLQVVDPRKDVLFPTALSDAFAYLPGSSYFSEETLSVGNGYWLKFGLTDSINIVGDTILADSIEIAEGWNLIGSISMPVAVQDIASLPPAITTSDFFGYDQSYLPSDTIQPGKGYWVKVNQNGTLILSAGKILHSEQHIKILSITELPPPPPEIHDDKVAGIPRHFYLKQNYPNPFNPITKLEYQVANSGFVTLKVYDILGREIATLINDWKEPGDYQAVWNAENVPSGVYLARLQMGKYSDIKKFLLVR